MTDWKPGDIALSLITFKEVRKRAGHETPVKGRFYSVTGVTQGKSLKGLLFKEVPCKNPFGYAAYRFIKVTPKEADEFDKETIELYNKTPVKETT